MNFSELNQNSFRTIPEQEYQKLLKLATLHEQVIKECFEDLGLSAIELEYVYVKGEIAMLQYQYKEALKAFLELHKSITSTALQYSIPEKLTSFLNTNLEYIEKVYEEFKNKYENRSIVANAYHSLYKENLKREVKK